MSETLSIHSDNSDSDYLSGSQVRSCNIRLEMPDKFDSSTHKNHNQKLVVDLEDE